MKILKKIKKIFKSFFSYKKEDQIYALLFFLFPCAVGIFTAGIISIDSPIKNFTIDNDWIGFYGSMFGGLLGVLITLFIFKLRDEKERRKKQKELKLYSYQYFEIHLNNIKNRCHMIKKEIKERNKIDYYRKDIFKINDYSERLTLLLLEEQIDPTIVTYNSEIYQIIDKCENINSHICSIYSKENKIESNQKLKKLFNELVINIEEIEDLINTMQKQFYEVYDYNSILYV